jgi:DNA-binding response OmpR family regulator
MAKDTILIADDDRLSVHALAAYLKGRGFQIISAADAMQAVMYAMRTPLAAVFLDIKMPGGTGLEVLKKLKASVKTGNVPVIVITGSDDPDLPHKVRELSADEFLSKPIDLSKVNDILNRLLGEPHVGG